MTAEFHGAELVVRVVITEIFVNCPHYIHKYQRVGTSKYVPQKWKRINAVQDVLLERDKNVAESLGGVITPEEYGEMLLKDEAEKNSLDSLRHSEIV